MEERIKKRVEQARQEHILPGCVIGIVKANGERHVWPFGNCAYEPDSEKVAEDTIYDLASITKSIPTASLALLFIKEGKLSLGSKVKEDLPELENDHNATIEDLLRYRVHGVQLSKLRYSTFEEIRTHVFEHGFAGSPGEPMYTNLPAFLLGIILERVGKSSLSVLAHRYFFEPLGMHDTTFFPSFAKASEGKPHRDSRIAPTEVVDGEEIRGIVHDESARVFAKARRAVGYAGLFGTASDLLLFFEALLTGQYPDIVEGAEQGLGWQLDQKYFMGKYAGPRTFGKTGFTGCSVVCDVAHGTAFVILSNRTYPKRPQNDDAINSFRRDIADIMLSSR